MGKSILNWSGITDNKLSNTSNHPLTNKAATEEFLRQQALLDAKEAELKSLINQANTAINAVKAMKATTTSVGMVQLSTSASATDPNAGALSVTEKNASMSGSLANQIKVLQNKQFYGLLSNYITMQNGYMIHDDEWYNHIAVSGDIVTISMLLCRGVGSGKVIFTFKNGIVPRYPTLINKYDPSTNTQYEFRVSPGDNGLVNMSGNPIPDGGFWMDLHFSYIRNI